MTEVTFAPSANIDVIAALTAIQNYFLQKESPELAKSHIALFEAELKGAEKRLAEYPEFYSVREEYSGNRYGRQYRTFNFHWFIAFYTYTLSEGVFIWHIRSSRSDYSDIAAHF